MKWFRPAGFEDPRLQEVAAAIAKGELAILPTDTVYGLSCDAFDANAVANVFRAKKRDETSSLIVLAHNVEQAKSLASEWSGRAQKAADRFWPGPLTLVLPKAQRVPRIVSGGKETVAVRVPGSELLRKIIESAGTPIVSTSANTSGASAPTSAGEAVQQVGEHVAYVVDTGACDESKPSTILDLTAVPARVLREGAVSMSDLAGLVNI